MSNKRQIQLTLVIITLIISGLFVNMTRVSLSTSPWKTIASFSSTGSTGTTFSAGYDPNGPASLAGYSLPINQTKIPSIDNCDYRAKIMRKNSYNGSWEYVYMSPISINTTTSMMSWTRFEFNLKDTSTRLDMAFANTADPGVQVDKLNLSINLSKSLDGNASLAVYLDQENNASSIETYTKVYLEEKCSANNTSIEPSPTLEPVQATSFSK